jgi:hypothetical protein
VPSEFPCRLYGCRCARLKICLTQLNTSPPTPHAAKVFADATEASSLRP